MLRVGLTGSLASGKSTVAEMFRRRGAKVLDADAIAHETMRPGGEAYEQVLQQFGHDLAGADGAINRALLAERAFGGGRIQELNRIVHPAVIAQQERWLAEQARSDAKTVAIVEAALILEAGLRSRFDKILVVTCAPEQRLQRFAARAGLSLEPAAAEVKRRLAAQMPETEKINAADYVIDNSGSREQTEAQVDKIWNSIVSSQ